MRIVLWFALSLLFRCVWSCSVPPPTIVCRHGGCKIYNHQGTWEERFRCTASAAYFPKTEASVVKIMAAAVKANQTVNVISNLAHSLTPLACVGDGGVIISTRDLSSFISVDTHAQTITVDAGVHLREVFDEAAKQGLTLYNAPNWDGVTAAGCISTGAHGSGLHDKGSGVYEQVTSLRMVIPGYSSKAYAKVIELKESDEELKAARLSLGMLGVITRVTFKLEPMFKRTFSRTLVNDDNLEDIFHTFLYKSEFAIISWIFGGDKASLITSRKVSTDVSGDANVPGSFYPPQSVQSLEDAALAYEQAIAKGDINRLCIVNRTTPIPPPSPELVGYNDKMTVGGGCESYQLRTDPDRHCLPNKILDKNETVCLWDRRTRSLKPYDLAVAVPMSRARDAINDLKKLREVSPPGAFCQMVSPGMGLRTIKKSEAYLGPSEDLLSFEFLQYQPRIPFTPSPNMDVFQEMEQILVQKHGGRLHWGKSGGFLFRGQARTKTVDFEKFMKVKRRYDPKGVFSNAWTDGLFGVSGKGLEVVRKGCGIEKMCKCSQDSHCAPHLGYLCKPGRLWTKARVCRKV